MTPTFPLITAALLAHLFTQTSSGGGTTAFGYDLSGNTLWKEFSGTQSAPAERVEYTWDQLNRLTGAVRSVGGAVTDTASFLHAGARWESASQTVNGETRNFAWGYGGELLAETVPGCVTRAYVNSGLDQVLWSLDTLPAQSARFFLNDVNGSVHGIADDTGNIIERQRFEAYGKTEITNAAGSVVNSQSAIGNRLGFQGRTGIPELGLQYFRNRFYDPGIGRFLSRDPLGMVDGPNVYGLCGGDPVNRMDPMDLAFGPESIDIFAKPSGASFIKVYAV